MKKKGVKYLQKILNERNVLEKNILVANNGIEKIKGNIEMEEKIIKNCVDKLKSLETYKIALEKEINKIKIIKVRKEFMIGTREEQIKIFNSIVK